MLAENLNQLWLDNEHESILFLWYTSLGAQALEWFNLTDLLDLTQTFPATLSSTTESRLTSAQAAITIVNYEREKKSLLLQRTVITCPVCMNDVYGSDCFSCYTCSGIACKSCIKSYLDTLIHEGQVKSITCPIDPTCHVELTPAQIASLVEKKVFHRYDRLLFQLSMESMDDITYCPRCEKPVILTQEENADDLSKTLGECATCSFVFCTVCRKTFHGVNPCQYSASTLIHEEEEDTSRDARSLSS